MEEWERLGVFEKRSWFSAVPDANLTNIEIDDGHRHVSLATSHELTGPTSIPERQRQRYETWDKLRNDVRSLIPPNGEPYHGTVSHNTFE